MKRLLAILALIWCGSALAGPAYPLLVSQNSRYLVDQNGKPVFIHASSPWSAICQLNASDAEMAISNLAKLGVNGGIVNLIEHKFADHAPTNFYGVAPFTNKVSTFWDYTSINPDYYTNADNFIRMCGKYGFCVYLNPAFLGVQPGGAVNAGWYQDMNNAGFATVSNYGRYIGTRYKSFTNIVWHLAGDYTGSGSQNAIQWLVSGITNTDLGTHLIECEGDQANGSSGAVGTTGFFFTPPGGWNKVNTIYEYNIPHIATIAQEMWNSNTVAPFILFESNYELENNSPNPSLPFGSQAAALQMRQQAWSSAFNGACGEFWGSSSNWQFTAGWQNLQYSLGATTLTNVPNFMATKDWWNGIPDTNHAAITSGYGTINNANFVSVLFHSASNWAVAYVPGSQNATTTLTVDLSRSAGFGKKVNVNWFSPTYGTNSPVQTFNNTGTQTFTTPDTNDWVLNVVNTNQSWYVDNSLTASANTGTNWVNAFTNFSSLPFNIFSSPHISIGDTIYISGGPSGGSQVYNMNILDAGQSSTAAGSSTEPITITYGRDAPHSGQVVINGRINLSEDYWVIDGRKNFSLGPADSIYWSFFVNTTCNIKVANPSSQNNIAVYVQGTGCKVLGCEISNFAQSNEGIYYQDGGSGHGIGNGSELAWNWLHDVDGFGVRGEQTYYVSTNYGQLSIHHNKFERIGDNFMQFPGQVDYFRNAHGDQETLLATGQHTYSGHPDCVQEVSSFSRIFQNFYVNNQGSRVYIEANSTLTHDVLVYGNLWYSTTNWMGMVLTNRGSGTTTIFGMGTSLDLTGHDRAVNDGAPLLLSNLWYFNNTVYCRGTNPPQSGFIWSSGPETGGADRLGTVTNEGIWNNLFVPDPVQASTCFIQLPTNIPPNYVNFSGFEYRMQDVMFDYNSISLASGKGQGIVGWDGGKQDLSNLYTNMADFGLRTIYKSNNNSAAKFVWNIPATDPYSGLVPVNYFKPQIGDTALVGNGTNLTSALTNIAPFMGLDMYNNSHPATPSIGALEIPSGFWVDATNGNNANPGTFAAPWKTITKAGNTLTSGQVVNIVRGYYDEYVTPVNGGVTFRGYPENDPLNPVIVKGFTLGGSASATNQTIEGLTFDGWSSNTYAIFINGPSAFRNGSSAVVTNNTFRNGVVGVVSSNTTFFSSSTIGSNYIHFADFIEGGDLTLFRPGMNIYLGSYSLKFYTNCGAQDALSKFYVVDHVDNANHNLYVTNLFQADSVGTYYSWIIGGNSALTGAGAILAPLSGGSAATNVIVQGNTFSNLFGCVLNIGFNPGPWVVTGNLFTRNHGQYTANPNASNFYFTNNAVIHNKNLFHFGYGDLGNPAIHPGGGKFNDNQCCIFQTSFDGVTNQVIANNVFWDCDNEAMETDWYTNSTGWHFLGNIVYAIPTQGALNMNGSDVETNTFIASGYDEGTEAWTGEGNTTQNPMMDADNVGNLWVNTGGHYNEALEGPYGTLTNTYGNFTVSNNVSITFETKGYTKTLGDNVIKLANGSSGTGMLANNGDPQLVNIQNPVDPNFDWTPRPFYQPKTAFTGFRPLIGSYVSTLGIGALPPVSSLQAHYTITIPVMKYWDLTITNFDSVWAGMTAWARPDVIHPVSLPPAIGSNSVATTFYATNSCDGLTGGTNKITGYFFSCSDGFTSNSLTGIITHTLSIPGTNTMSVTVTNTTGATSTYSASYRVLGPIGDPGITVQPGNQTVTAPATATFTVGFVGTAPLSQQWYKNGVLIPGATSTSYTTPATSFPLNNGDQFYVIVTSANGSLQSATATLFVNTDISITQQPQNQTVLVGQTATFTIVATGAADHYQWTFNGANVGSDNATLTMPNCQLSQNGGVIQCSVFNTGTPAPGISSATATLTVNPQSGGGSAAGSSGSGSQSPVRRGSLNFERIRRSR